MSVHTYPDAPYYDDYDPTKGYVQVLAKAGNYAQSREFSQIGTMFRDQLGNLGDAILTNGQIISGCDLVISGTTAILQPGRIYLNGLVRVIYEAISVQITGVGTETVGIKIEEQLITAAEDESLRNPAVGTEGYQQEGASRVRQLAKLTVDDNDAVSLYTLVDGEIYVEKIAQDDDSQATINNMLAKRTYDTSGNFKVEGLDISDKTTTDGTSQIYVGAGSAYIYGYNVRFDNMHSVNLTIPTEFRTCNNEPKIYKQQTDKFYFVNNPLKKINQVTSRVTVTREITRGTIGGGSDELPDQPVQSIVEITAGSKTYTEGVDYTLIGNSVDWSPSGDEPASGSTYTVVYIYMRTNIQGTDFTIGGSGNDQYIQFLSTGTLPNPNSEILIDYDFYLSRMDTICIDRAANISVLEGVSDRADLCEAPINGDNTKLVLGTVLSYANTTNKKILNSQTRRLTQTELYNVKKRLEDVELNQAQKDLDDEAKEGEDATLLKGIFTDGFVGYTKADLTNSEFDCSIDVDNQELTVGFDTGVVTLSVNEDSSTAQIHGRIVSSPYNNVVAMSQPRATTRFLVNPYAVYGKLAICTLDPAVDNWIETSTIVINQETTRSYSLRRWWYHRGEAWAQAERQRWIQITGTTGEQLNWGNYYGSATSPSTSVKDEAITYMRQMTVTVNGSNFEPSEDNIECYFNGTKVPMTGQSIVGAMENTVKANSNGRLSFKFTVPAKTPCGSVEVKLVGPITTAKATYTAEGTKRTTTNKVLRSKVIVTTNDPLAQTFQFENDTILTGLDLFFASKDANRSIIVQVRDVVNGYPGTTCYVEEELRPDDITVNGNAPVATHITFSQPVYCNENTQYCFVVESDSNVYQLWQATMGEKDVVTGATVTAQPFTEGVMFSSSNGLTWTAHQMSDITFNLYKAEYTGRGEIIFENVSALDFNRILVAAETEDHKNAGIEWYYKINSSTVWEPIETYVDRSLDEEGTSVSLRAIINIAQSTSPIIANDCINLVYFKDKLKGTYVSRMVEFDEDFNNIKVSAEFALPTGCTAKVYYKLPDVSDTWVQMELSGEATKVDNEFDRYIYSAEGVAAKQYRVKVELETTNPLNRPRARKLMSILKY